MRDGSSSVTRAPKHVCDHGSTCMHAFNMHACLLMDYEIYYYDSFYQNTVILPKWVIWICNRWNVRKREFQPKFSPRTFYKKKYHFKLAALYYFFDNVLHWGYYGKNDWNSIDPLSHRSLISGFLRHPSEIISHRLRFTCLYRLALSRGNIV